MDIALLKTFLEVTKLRHFGRAADNLFITQSAVSARIKLLEETLGVELFVRKRNNIQLTPAGNRLQQHAENILKGWERARQAIALDPDLSASLAVGCVFDLWTIFVDKWVKGLRKASPDIALQVDIQTSETMIQRLTLGALDLAFMFDPPQAPDLELRQVTTAHLLLVSTKPELSIDDAMQSNYVMVDWGSAFSILHAENFPELPAPTLRTNSGQVALGLLQDRGGSAYLPQPLVARLLKDKKIFLVKNAPVIDRMAYVAYHPENIGKTSLQKAMQALKFK